MSTTPTKITVNEMTTDAILNAVVANNEKLIGISQADWDNKSEDERKVSLGVRRQV